jgi:hypothetical protein
MAELWFDTVEDFLAARQSPEWTASTEDEANFIEDCRPSALDVTCCHRRSLRERRSTNALAFLFRYYS